jgi:hypothetical protein
VIFAFLNALKVGEDDYGDHRKGRIAPREPMRALHLLEREARTGGTSSGLGFL